MLFRSLFFSALSVATVAQGGLKLVYQFPASQPVGLENLVIRPNGNLLLTAQTAPIVYQLNPANPVPQVVAALNSGTASTQGIAEYSTDQYAVSTGNYSFNPANPGPPSGVKGSFQVWTLNLNGAPKAQLLTKIPEAVALNGATAVPGCPEIVLVADAGAGAVWQVNVKTGAYKVALQDPLFAATTYVPLGINGIKIRGDYLYFTNSAQAIFGKMKINYSNYQVTAAGAAQAIASPQGASLDDFALDGKGTAYIANHPSSVLSITQYGQVAVAVNSTSLLDPTAVAIDSSGCNAYITTQGSFTIPAGGQVYALNVCGQRKAFKA